jgi:ribosomal protein S18 acetylase RimI-like enzyme
MGETRQMHHPYQLIERIPTLDEYRALCTAVGWEAVINFEAAKDALPNSLYGVVVVHQGRTIGMGRVVGDGAIYYYLQDIAVLPEHQGRGVGHMIIQQLYRRLFPGAYYSAERFIDMIGRGHQVLVAAEGSEVIGFVVVSADAEWSTAEIQFVGVREDRRRRGYGRALLLSAIDWLVDSEGAAGIGLSVGEELVGAQGLYESVGFRLRFVGVGFRKVPHSERVPAAVRRDIDR